MAPRSWVYISRQSCLRDWRRSNSRLTPDESSWDEFPYVLLFVPIPRWSRTVVSSWGVYDPKYRIPRKDQRIPAQQTRSTRFDVLHLVVWTSSERTYTYF